MTLKHILNMIEPYTVICLTHRNMSEDWYINKRVIPENILHTPMTITSIGVIHPKRNEFGRKEPAIRIYLEEL